MSRNRPVLLCSLLVVSFSAFAHPGTHEEGVTHDPETGEHVQGEVMAVAKGPFSRGRVVFRGGANMDLNSSINLGGRNEGGAAVIGGVRAGVGYFIIDNLSLDLDGVTHLQLSPAFGFQDLGLTPGARYQFIPQAYLRVGAPLLFLPAFGAGVLGGAGYHQPLGKRSALVVGADYTYYLTETYRRTAPLGKVDFHAGVQTSF